MALQRDERVTMSRERRRRLVVLRFDGVAGAARGGNVIDDEGEEAGRADTSARRHAPSELRLGEREFYC